MTADLFYGVAKLKKVPPNVTKVARRKLAMVDAAELLSDLAVPPGNQLEALKGNMKGYHSIRVNDQWRVVFKWKEDGPHEVWFTDYH